MNLDLFAPIMTYNGDNLSIIFQGPNFRGDCEALSTLECIRRTREAYPKAEIIFSTWENSPEIQTLVDKIIVNSDPGPLESAQSAPNYLININRQIVSTRAGLVAAERQFSIKIRCDSFLRSVDLAFMFHEYGVRNKFSKFFDAPIFVSACGCVNPTRWPALFFISDFFHFGLTSDLRRLWSVQLCPQDYGSYHCRFPVAAWRVASSPGHYERFAPEQYVWTTFLRQQGLSVSIDATLGFTPSSYKVSERMFAGHFISFPSKEMGLNLPRRFARLEEHRATVFRDDWLELRYALSCGNFDAWVDGRLRRYLVANILAFMKYYIRIPLRPIFSAGSRIKRIVLRRRAI